MNRVAGPIVLLLCMLCAFSAIAEPKAQLPAQGLIVDLDADHGVELKDGKVINWRNRIDWKAKDFKATRITGRPALRTDIEAINHHAAVVFDRQELINDDEDAFDSLITGSGYTWFAVISVQKQIGEEKDVNAFFGDLKNGGNFEGFWAGVKDDNTLWMGSRNSTTFGRWDENNPKVLGPQLKQDTFYVVAGRMEAGTGKVKLQLFVNSSSPAAEQPFPVNPKANSSKMAIGQERDATNHPGRESFRGALARILFWNRPLTDTELADTFEMLKSEYGVH